MKTIKHLRTANPNLNQFLEENPAPAPASDNSDSVYINYLQDPAVQFNKNNQEK